MTGFRVQARPLMALAALASLGAAGSGSAQVFDPSSYRNTPYGSPMDGSGQYPDSRMRSESGSTVSTQPTQTPFQPGSISTAKSPDSDLGELLGRSLTANGQENSPAVQLKPRPEPNEFERYVQQATGQRLKRFGEDLLVPGARDFALPATVAIPADYKVNVGDIISVNLIGSVDGSSEFKVDRNGEIFLPSVGPVNVAGVRYADLKDRVSRAVGGKYRGFEISVTIAKLRGIQVYVTGFANNPGSYTVSSLSTLANAVLAAGGPNAGGSLRDVILKRGGQEYSFDLYDLLRHGDRSKDLSLQNEDVLYIPPIGPQAAVVGSVREQAIYELRKGESLQELLNLAGGANQMADASRIVLYRLSDKNTVGSREIQKGALAATPGEAGDIVQLLSTGSLATPLENQWVTVRLEGEVRTPGNYYVAPNTPLAEVMRMAGGLTERAYPYGTKLLRESVRAQQRENFQRAVDQFEGTLISRPLTNNREMSAAELDSMQTLVKRMKETEPSGRLVLDIPYGARAVPGDLILENNDKIVVPPLVGTVGVFGSVYRPASFLLDRNAAPKRVSDYIDRAGGMERAADKKRTFIVRANGDVISGKQGALHARVQPGDVVFVPVKIRSATVLDKIRDISQIIFQFGLAGAAVAAIQ